MTDAPTPGPRPKAAALATATVFLALFLAMLAPRLPLGTLTNTDELLTAERSREMLLHGPGAVHFNHRPDFHKPPLQYWLTALTLPRLADAPELAVRLWSLVYGALTAAAVWLLARAVDPGRPWTAALAVGLFVTCPLVVTEARRGLLDMGLTFFATVAIAGAMHAARGQTRHWFVAAAACVLASLQKGPLALVFWIILVAAGVLLAAPAERRNLRAGRPALALALGLAVLAMACWPLWQIVGHGMPLAEAFGFSEAATLTGSSRLGARAPFYALRRLTTNWVWGGPALLAAAGFLLAPGRERRPAGLAEISALCLTGIALALALGFRSVRYLLPLVPTLCVLVAAGLHRLGEARRSAAWLFLVFGGAVTLFGIGAEQAWRRAFAAVSDAPEQRELARELGVRARETGASAVCLLRRAEVDNDGDANGVLYPSFYLFYGDLAIPVRETTVARLARAPEPPTSSTPTPTLGICRGEDFHVVQTYFPGATAQSTRGEFLRWEVTGGRHPQPP